MNPIPETVRKDAKRPCKWVYPTRLVVEVRIKPPEDILLFIRVSTAISFTFIDLKLHNEPTRRV